MLSGIVLCAVVQIVLLAQSDIPFGAFVQIRFHMTEEQVCRILARPPNAELDEDDYFGDTIEMWGDLRRETRYKYWWGHVFSVIVHFDDQGRVVGARYSKVESHRPGVVKKWLRFLRWVVVFPRNHGAKKC